MDRPQPEDPSGTPFDKFKNLTRKLLAVPKKDVAKAIRKTKNRRAHS